MNRCLLFAAVFLSAGGAVAATPEIALWPGTPPSPQHTARAGTEKTEIVKKPVAGRPWTEVENVSKPTITIYSPTKDNTGAAVIVFPGGGYQILAIDLEGTEVCDWLTSKGITCIVLKYRVPNDGPLWEQEPGSFRDTGTSMALEDAQRAMGIVRLRSAEWNIDPHKVGVLGFSAGGHLSAAMSTRFEKRVYPPVDAADKESCRPDFGVLLYPGHLWVDHDKFVLSPEVPVTNRTPPSFIVQAEDDDVDSVNNSLVYYQALLKAKVPAEMHIYAHGRHAFGLRRTKFPITEWPQLAETWLASIGMIPR